MAEPEDHQPPPPNHPELDIVLEAVLGPSELVTPPWLLDEGISWTSSTAPTTDGSCSTDNFDDDSDRDRNTLDIEIRAQFDEAWPEDLELTGRDALPQIREALDSEKVIVSL